MNAGLDVRRAIHEANDVFNRFPIRLCLPMILFGAVSFGTTGWLPLEHRYYTLIVMAASFVEFWLSCFAQVVVSSMGLRAWEGAAPGGTQVREAIHSPKFGSLIWGLFLRYIGWIAVIIAIIGVIGMFAGLFSLVIHEAAAPANGISRLAGGFHLVGIAIGVIAALVFATVIFSRYELVLPMFAMARASGPGFLDDCVARTKPVWKTVALVMVVGGLPALLFGGFRFLIWRSVAPPHGIHLAVQFVGTLLIYCCAAWFILLKTGLARQLVLEQSPLPPELPPLEPLAGLSDGLIL